jgi:hypothetical protein
MPARPVVCRVKWGTKYPPPYVNRLRITVARHFAHPHDFVHLHRSWAGKPAMNSSVMRFQADEQTYVHDRRKRTPSIKGASR